MNPPTSQPQGSAGTTVVVGGGSTTPFHTHPTSAITGDREVLLPDRLADETVEILDCNAVLETGCWAADTSASNAPASSFWTIRVVRYGIDTVTGNFATQWAEEIVPPYRIFRRNVNVITWTAWEECSPPGWAKRRARLATTSAVTNPTSGAPNSVDGVTPVVGDRILNTGSHAACGLYTVTTVGTGSNGVWARAADAATAADIAGVEVAVSAGTTYGGTRWATSFKSTDTLGTTAMTWGLISDLSPHFKGAITAATAITAGADIAFPSVEDTHSGYSSGVYTVPRDGVYLVTAALQYNSSPPVNNSLNFHKGGTQRFNGRVVTNINFGGVHESWTTRCVAGDTLSVRCAVGFTTVAAPAGTENSFWTVQWLRS